MRSFRSMRHPYIASKTETSDPNGSNPQIALSTQTLDQYGNVTAAAIYPYNNTTTPLNTYSSTYLTDSGYLATYIRNRLLWTTLTTGGTSYTLTQNYYDGKNFPGQPAVYNQWSSYGPAYSQTQPTTLIDSHPPISFTNRGLMSDTISPAKSTWTTFYQWGSPYQSTSSDGSSVTAPVSSTTNYSAPDSLATQTYSQTIAYNSWLGITSTTGLNGEQLSMTYDAWGRPLTGTSPYGAMWSYSYTATTPIQQTKSGPDGYTRTTLDGFGRTIRVERGLSSTNLQSVVDTVYAPCACSPLGKIQKVSAPYQAPSAANQPGGSAGYATPSGTAWTIYSYDGIGRTLYTQQPDGASTTNYLYSGNQTTVTDPAGKWKTFTSDVLGNLASVTEPDPANQPGGTLPTLYGYDYMKNLTCVDMVRGAAPPTVPCDPGYTTPAGATRQMRTFVYDSAGRLTTATNPENGTVSYYYNSDNTLQYKHDAKGQDAVYTYDSGKRVIEVQRYPNGKNNGEDTCEEVNYAYDSPYDSTGKYQYTYGRLSYTTYQVCQATGSNGNGTVPTVTDIYSYHPAGAVTVKHMNINAPGVPGQSSAQIWDMEVDYTYTGWGAVSSMTPVTSPVSYAPPAGGEAWAGPFQATSPVTYIYSFDAMGRPVGMRDNDPNRTQGQNWVQGVQYDFAGRLTSWQHYLGTNGYLDEFSTDTYTYNALSQVTSATWGNGTNYQLTPGGVQYTYSATQNNGQITQSAAIVNGQTGQTTVYQYDALKRLISASASGGYPAAWTENFGYDGYGNLTSKVLNNGANSIPAVNPATNRLTSVYYDNNGNMTSGAGVSLTYDVANRVISATPSSGGTDYYGYAPDNKRIYRALNNVWTLYGTKGEKVGTFQLYWGGQDSPVYPYTLVFSTQLQFAGRTIWDTGSGVQPGTAVANDRLGSNRMTSGGYYPFGEEIAPTGNGGIKFATYTRDLYTGLDYADQRYYASSYGRFGTPDPYGDNWLSSDPPSWNMYSYAEGDPIGYYDPTGLSTCGQLDWSVTGQTLNSITSSGSNLGLLTDTVFTESAESTSAAGSLEMGAIASVVMNRWQILNGYYWLTNTNGSVIQVSPDWGPPGASLAQIMQSSNNFAVWQNNGSLAASAQANLNSALSSDAASPQCQALAQAFFTADLYLSEQDQHQLYQYNGLVLTSFNSNNPSKAPSSWESTVGSFGSANVFYGIPFTQTEYVPAKYGQPIPERPRPIRPHPPKKGGNRPRPLILAGQ